MREPTETKYALLLPNHEALAYYRYTDLNKAKKDAQRVADGWHEIVEVVIIQPNVFKVVERVKPKTEIAKVPAYEFYGNRTWSMEWKQDK